MDGTVEIIGPLIGRLVPAGRELMGQIATDSVSITGELTVPSVVGLPLYDGSYEVTPLPETEQILETSGRRMEDDVVVLAIPYYETTNESGGYTVNIG